jgi:hypothetical protein
LRSEKRKRKSKALFESYAANSGGGWKKKKGEKNEFREAETRKRESVPDYYWQRKCGRESGQDRTEGMGDLVVDGSCWANEGGRAMLIPPK